MKFRPCIDLHEGKVKQIVGSTLSENRGDLVENFVSDRDPADYARLFKRDNMPGGHVIMLGKGNEDAALSALAAYPGGLQVGGGINDANAWRYLDAGASHVILTSFIFQPEGILFDRLDHIAELTGKNRLVIDFSCRRTDKGYFVAVNQWRTLTPIQVDQAFIKLMEQYCDEFLIHAVDVEGKNGGMDSDLVGRLSDWCTIPATYAGGIRSLEDIETLDKLSGGMLDFTVGSALDLFGGSLPYQELVKKYGR